VSKHFFDVKDVLGLVILHCSFPVSKGMEGYSVQPWILQLKSDSFALVCEVNSKYSKR